MNKCKFDKAWQCECGKEADESGFCEEHKQVKCCSCGEQATHECAETGQFVCGFPLCDDCTHNTHPKGHNGGIGFNAEKFPKEMKTHCKKSDQKYAPWYIDESNVSEWKELNGIHKDKEVILTNNNS